MKKPLQFTGHKSKTEEAWGRREVEKGGGCACVWERRRGGRSLPFQTTCERSPKVEEGSLHFEAGEQRRRRGLPRSERTSASRAHRR